VKIGARDIGQRREMNDDVSAVKHAAKIGVENVRFDELVAAVLGEVKQRGVAFRREVVEHHDLDARQGAR
jgi:hypothetical protein